MHPVSSSNKPNENTPLIQNNRKTAEYEERIGYKPSTLEKVGAAVCIIFVLASFGSGIYMTVLAGMSSSALPVLCVPLLILTGYIGAQGTSIFLTGRKIGFANSSIGNE